MKHLGDITKISGYTAPMVDVAMGGSPCQDLSVAGKGEGLKGERSGLFMDMIRIVKEMRERDRTNGRTGVNVRPRFLVWENVPGAFSSNKGEDFKAVLEEIAKVADKNTVIPEPPNGKWSNTGCIVGDGWSVAWRVFDAQFWGVPQRRRRISLVADFGSECAGEILFVRKGLSGNTDESEQKRKETAGDATESTRTDDCAVAYSAVERAGKDGGGKGLLLAPNLAQPVLSNSQQTVFQPVYAVENHPQDSRIEIDGDGICQTLTQKMGTGGGNVPLVMTPFSKSRRAKDKDDFETWKKSDVANTLNTFDQGDKRSSDIVVCLDRASYNQGKNAQFDIGISEDGTAQTLVAKGPNAVCYAIGSYDSNAWKSKNPESGVYETDKCKTLDSANCCYPACNQGGIAIVEEDAYGFPLYFRPENAKLCKDTATTLCNGTRPGFTAGVVQKEDDSRYIVRRLTPLECERLQGFPDGWTDIGIWADSKGKMKKSSDAARYKALGNSISLPNWKWVLKKISAMYERDATMASMFDGIGGFPFLWEKFNGKGSCLWASEIEEFPMAVTKKRLGGDMDAV